MNLNTIQKKLYNELDKDRYTHTMGVMYTAASLAMAYGADIEQAMIAGLLHDCAKCIPNKQKLSICRKYSIKVTLAEEENPFLLHAKVGAFLAQKEYNVEDPKIIHAILVHTTGAPEMNQLDKIIYIADYIEPYRKKAPHLKEVRTLAFQNLDLAMLKILSDTLKYLKKNKDNIDPLTLKTYKYFKRKGETIKNDPIKRTGKSSL